MGEVFLPADHLSAYQEGLAVTLWACVRKMPGSNVGRDAGRSSFEARSQNCAKELLTS